jgi:hypothetical protein
MWIGTSLVCPRLLVVFVAVPIVRSDSFSFFMQPNTLSLTSRTSWKAISKNTSYFIIVYIVIKPITVSAGRTQTLGSWV